MKPWHQTLLGFLAGVFILAVIFLTAAPPRGTQVELLPAPTAAPMVVHITGAVKAPGVYQLPVGSRVEDAVRAAGGLAAQADPGQLNLAARLVDGSQVRVPEIGKMAAEAAPQPEINQSQPIAQEIKILNINTASLEELQTLPGIGQVRAEQIIAYREANSGFKTLEELLEVPGIGPATYKRLEPLISIEPMPVQPDS